LFDEIKIAMDDKLARAAEDPLVKQDENLQLEQDVIVPLVAGRKIYVYETTDFWRQMKTAA
jgi:mannose-1-phosphate guanylyltransferase